MKGSHLVSKLVDVIKRIEAAKVNKEYKNYFKKVMYLYPPLLVELNIPKRILKRVKITYQLRHYLNSIHSFSSRQQNIGTTTIFYKLIRENKTIIDSIHL